MSSRKTGTSKEKRTIGSGILSLVRKKSRHSKTQLPLDPQLPENSSGSAEATELTSTESVTEVIHFKPDYFEAEEEGQIVQELRHQLQEAQNILTDTQKKSLEDQEIINELQNRLEDLGNSHSNLQKRLKEMAEDKEVVILKQQVEDLHQQLQKKQELDKHVQRLTDEMADLQTQNQELRFHQDRSSTRSRINSISEDKYTKEEVLRLQKTLRMMEMNKKVEVSGFEAQLKAAQDGNERLQEKVRVSQLRYDELDRERLDLKIEINRLQKKLEKAGSYTELKRLQTEQESVELELRNLRRKNAKLERQLNKPNSNQGVGHDSKLSGISYSTRTLSQSTYLEKEIAELDATVSKLRSENKKLDEMANASKKDSEVLNLKVKQLDDQLQAEKSRAQEIEVSFGELKKAAAVGSDGGEYLEGLLKEIETLKQTSREIETKFKVKEKDLWSTIEAQKMQIEDIEMEKLALELGEAEECGGDEKEPSPKPQFVDKIKEMQAEIDGLRRSKSALEQELQNTKQSAEKLAEITAELDGLRQTNTRLESETLTATQKLDELSQNKASHQDNCDEEMDKYQNEIKELQQANGNLQISLEKEAASGKASEVSLKKLQAINDDISKKLKESEESTKAASNLKTELQKVTQQVDKLQATNNDLSKKLKVSATGAEKQASDLKGEVKSLKQEISALKKLTSPAPRDGRKVSFDENSELKRDVEKLTDLNAQLTKDLEAAEEEIDHREDTNVKLAEDLEKLQNDNKKLKGDLELAEDELEKVDFELIHQTGKLSEQIAQLKKENSEVSEHELQ